MNEKNSEVKQQANYLLSNLRNLLAAQTMSTWHGDKRRGQINSRSLHRLRTGGAELFRQKESGKELDTAALIVMDWSGSMACGRSTETLPLVIQLQVVYTLSNALDILGIANKVVAFHNVGSHEMRGLSRAEFDTYNRFSAFRFIKFKDWNEKAMKVSGNFNPNAGGRNENNSDGEALEILSPELLARTEARKMMIVCSDGMPCDGASNDTVLEECLKAAVKKIEAQKVEVLGVGINSCHVEKFYGNNVVVDLKNFSQKLIGKLSEMILGVKKPAKV
jgi:cobaltochelatase CobT